MSDVSVAWHKAAFRLHRWLGLRSTRELLAGADAVSRNLPTLLQDGTVLLVDAEKLAADVVAKSVNVADLIAAGKDSAKAWTDLKKAYADFDAATRVAKAPEPAAPNDDPDTTE